MHIANEAFNYGKDNDLLDIFSAFIRFFVYWNIETNPE